MRLLKRSFRPGTPRHRASPCRIVSRWGHHRFTLLESLSSAVNAPATIGSSTVAGELVHRCPVRPGERREHEPAVEYLPQHLAGLGHVTRQRIAPTVEDRLQLRAHVGDVKRRRLGELIEAP